MAVSVLRVKLVSMEILVTRRVESAIILIRHVTLNEEIVILIKVVKTVGMARNVQHNVHLAAKHVMMLMVINK